MDEKEVREMLGDLHQLDKEMRAFNKSARKLLSTWGKIMEEYPQEWIGFHSGRVRAHGPSIDFVLKELDAKGFSREQAIVRFVETEQRKMHT